MNHDGRRRREIHETCKPLEHPLSEPLIHLGPKAVYGILAISVIRVLGR